MVKRHISLSLAGPTLLLSLLLFGLGTAAGSYLYFQQANTAAILSENVGSRRIAQELESTLLDLATLLRNNNKHLDALHGRIRSQLAEAWQYADKAAEKELVDQLEKSFNHYLKTWMASRFLEDPANRPTLQDALEILDKQTMPICRKLRDFNSKQIEESEVVHRRTVGWMSWGLGGVGVIGSLAGLVLGYGVARRIRRAIYQISVSVRDAANRLGYELPTVTLTEDAGLQHLHQQLEGLVPEIEQVVQKLQQREREVLRAEQLAGVGQLAAGVAHELRNPLTSIKMLVQTNREEAEANGLPAEDLCIIEQEIRRMERCLQNFLDFARPPKPEHRPLDLAAAVMRTFALVSGRAKKQRVELLFDQPDPPILVSADAEQMQQLFVNLALNALDAMPHGGQVRVHVEPAGHGCVEVRMEDTGPGIAADLLPRLFQPFVSTKETGLGLGLVVSQRIAESHAGQVRAANRPQGGACFILRLPLLRESEAAVLAAK